METRILRPTRAALAEAAAILREGRGLVGMPTETVYGLAGLGLDPVALAAIFAAKERPRFDPLILHIATPSAWDVGPRSWSTALASASAAPIVDLGVLSPAAVRALDALVAAYWPGPLTLVVPKTPAVPDLATSGLGTVAIRMPAHPVAQQLLIAVGAPLAAPSANRFGRISPTTARAVEAELHGRVALILEGGACEIGLESTVVAVAPSDGTLTILRPGRITEDDLAGTLGLPRRAISRGTTIGPNRAAAAAGAQLAPGMLPRHYSPDRPMTLLDAPFAAAVAQLARTPALHAGPAEGRGRALGAITFGTTQEAVEEALGAAGVRAPRVVVSQLGLDPAMAARRFFAALRALDEGEVSCILVEPVPAREGLFLAIDDRLRRAAAPAGPGPVGPDRASQ